MVVNADDIYNQQELELLISDNATYGIVCRDDKDKNPETVIFNDDDLLIGRINVTLDKPRWFGAGAYMLHKDIWLEKFHQLPNGEYSIPHKLIKAFFPVYVKKFSEWIPVNTPREIVVAESKLLKRF